MADHRPGDPQRLRQELVDELVAARRLVRSDPQAARPRVRDAKVEPGERGEPWWQPTPEGRREPLAAAIRALPWHRRPDASICPSEAAWVVGGVTWRGLMDVAREVAGELSRQKIVAMGRRGVDVDPADAAGPIRLARGPRW
ncbi:DUF3253 domain-containing protein [Catellatospora methionotrophica]|uniref:DUF3253 domain-containing protein n=1 Tax=Catellatospora methionotrophica TaxID=121620 RepID=UPI0033C37B1F